MSEKKITKIEKFAAMLDRYNFTDEDRAVIVHEIELLEKKKSSNRGLTKTQKENLEISNRLLASMEENVLYSVSDLCRIMGIESNQKMTHLLTKLVEDNKVVRTVDKRKAFFSLA